MKDKNVDNLSSATESSVRIGLTSSSYTSSEVFNDELMKVFRRQWLLVGNECLVPNIGDYFVKQVGPESLIIVRDTRNVVRAFFNVCRHRGYRLMDYNAAGCSKLIVCPYHKWTFEISGRLRGVPGARDGEFFDYSDWGLHEAQVGSWYGWLYVYLDEQKAPALESFLSPLTNVRAMEAASASRLRLAHRKTYPIAANWKSVLERV